jgi:hypothetical protein
MDGRWPRHHPDGAQRLDQDDGEPGDVITGIGYQFADGQKIVRLESRVES